MVQQASVSIQLSGSLTGVVAGGCRIKSVEVHWVEGIEDAT